jgi:hypothetical protein
MPRRALIASAVAFIAALILAQIVWRSIMDNDNWVRPALVALIAVFAFMLILSFIVPAHSQQPQMMQIKCAEASKQEQHLRDRFKEEPVWIGSNARGQAFFVVQSPDGKTWTWLMRQGNVTCIVADGDNGQFVDGGKAETF